MSFSVRVEREAAGDLRDHYRALVERSSDDGYPIEWWVGVRRAIEDLAESAHRCGLAFEDRFFPESIRQRLYGSYKILFTIRGRVVHVLHIRHQAQDPTGL